MSGQGADGGKTVIGDIVIKPASDGFALIAGGKAVRTPRKAELLVPTRALAAAITAEWKYGDKAFDSRKKPFTRLAFSVIDLGADEKESWRSEIASYLRTDLLCYRAQSPAELVKRQETSWGPVLEWIQGALGARLRVVAGVSAVDQPTALIERANDWLSLLDVWRLAALRQATTSTGSAILAFALLKRAFAAETLFAASRVDEDYQAEKWGVDDIAQERARRLETEFAAAAAFLDCLDGWPTTS